MNSKTISISLLFVLIMATSACQNSNQETKKENTSSSPDELSGKDTYVNPVDNNIYQTEGEWIEYLPEEKRVDQGIVQTKQIILLTNENDIEPRISVENLAEFIKNAEDIIFEEYKKSDKKGELLFQFNINDTGIPKVLISIKDDVDKEVTSQVAKKLEEIKGYATKQDSVVFQLHISIN